MLGSPTLCERGAATPLLCRCLTRASLAADATSADPSALQVMPRASPSAPVQVSVGSRGRAEGS